AGSTGRGGRAGGQDGKGGGNKPAYIAWGSRDHFYSTAMSRRNIARLIMFCWIAELAWLAHRQLVMGESARMTAGASRLPPEARYYRVDVGELQVGTVNMTWDTLPTGFRIEEMLSLDLPAGDGMTRHLALSAA